MFARNDIKLLEKVSLLEGLDRKQLERIRKACQVVSFPKGRWIIKENDPGGSLFILIEGKVEISKTLVLKVGRGSFEDKDKSFASLDASALPFFGEVSIVDGSPRSASVLAFTDCKLFEISKAEFDRMAEEDPRLGFILLKNICRSISESLRRTSNDILKLSTALSIALSR